MSFDALAPHYRWMECILAGHKLQRARTAFLDRIRPPGRILILGEGNGRFLVECRRAYPEASILCVDASRRMLALARRRLQVNALPSTAVEFRHENALQWTPPEREFDLLVTHFFLDCFPPDQLALVVSKLARAATDRASWLLADFCTPLRGFSRWRARVILWLMYRFFRLATRLPACRLAPPDPYLEGHHFKLQDRRSTEWGLLHSDWWQRTEPPQRAPIATGALSAVATIL